MVEDIPAGDPSEELSRLRQRVAELEAAEGERNRTEEALRESHEELQAIYDGMVDGLLVADIETKEFLRCNTAMCRMTGYSREELLSMSVMDLHPADHLPTAVENFEAQAEERLSVNQECPVLRKDGTVFHADISVGRTTYGGRRCMIGFFRDITYRRRAEQSLRESEEKYRTLVEASPDAVLTTDLEGRITFVSPQAVQLYGGNADELAGQMVSDLIAEEDRPSFEQNLARLLEKGVQRGDEYTVRRKDGTYIACEVSSAVLRESGKPFNLVAIVRDISRRRAAEDALRQSLQELQTIYDGIIEGLLITDVATKQFVRVNSSLCRMLGYTEEELLKASIQDIHPPEEVPNDLRRFQAAADRVVSINEDRPVLRKDGSIFYADITGHPIRFADRPCLLALFRDVTERKQAQEALERERRTLQHMLRASDHERQLIAYEIHDGLAQELAAATMQFQTYDHLKDRQPTGAKTAFEAGVQMLRQAHYEARRLISGVRPPILDESGITAAVAHLVHDHNQDPCPEIEFVGRVSFDRLAKVLENAIYRIAQEALTNACKHSESEKIRVSLVQEEGRVALEVQDWGIGFDPDAVAGDRFGLEGIRERVRLLGGQTVIESQPGEGTLVRVVLPLMVPEQDGSS